MRASRVWVTGLLVLLGGAASALAAGGPSGNSTAIAIARAEAHAYTQIRVERYTETGFVEMTDQEGRTSYFSFNWAQSKLSPGWVWATEHGVVALSHGRVVWWRDDLTPPACTAVGVCHQIPVELLSERRGAFYAFGNAAHHTCFGRLRGHQPVVVGAQWNRAAGHFSPPVFSPGAVKLTYTYSLGNGTTARETDTLSKRTYLLSSGRTVISGGHTIRFSTSHPARAPMAPKVNVCPGS
jgi:hypothetical protein